MSPGGLAVSEEVVLLRPAGAMFSSLWNVVGFTKWCKLEGKTPLVDLLTVRPMNTFRSVPARNSWTEYFHQLSSLSLEEVLESGEYSIYDRRPVSFAVHDYSGDTDYRETFHQTIKLSPRTQSYIDLWLDFLRQEGDVLGVHMRGTDMKIAKSHLAPPTTFQTLKMVDMALGRRNFDAIFVASEDERELAKIRKRYGKRIVTSDSFRTHLRQKMTRMDSPVLQWPYLLGLQVLRDTWMLAHCEGLVSGHSNVSEHAQVIRNRPYSVNLQIRRPRVDIFGSSKAAIIVTNFLRDISVSRYEGKDFKIVDKSDNDVPPGH
jgi:hypothetical protein